MIIKICPNCKKPFKTYPSINSLTCGKKCAYKYIKNQTIKRKQRCCKICNKLFVPCRTDIPGLYCSHKCHGIDKQKPFINRNGYRYIHKPDHPYCTKQGYVAEHRIIMEKHIGRILEPKEIIHHINHQKNYNPIENLILYKTRGKHTMNEHVKWENGRFVRK